MTGAVVLVVLGLLILGCIFYGVSIYNGLVTVKNNIDKSWSNVEVLLKQRHDELPKLVKVCERYMKHERETLERVIRARNFSESASTPEERGKADGMVAEALKSLFAVAERYPELKADEQFSHLQERISRLENEIADRRELYNESVNIYNIRIERIPDVFIARAMGFEKRPLWHAPASDLKDVEITFSS